MDLIISALDARRYGEVDNPDSRNVDFLRFLRCSPQIPRISQMTFLASNSRIARIFLRKLKVRLRDGRARAGRPRTQTFDLFTLSLFDHFRIP